MAIIKEKKVLSVFERLGKGPESKKTCIYWLKGRCNRNDCRFVHPALPALTRKHLMSPKIKPQLYDQLTASNRVDTGKLSRKTTWRNPNSKHSADVDRSLHGIKSGSLDQKQEPVSRKMKLGTGDNAANGIKGSTRDLLELKIEEANQSSIRNTLSNNEANGIKSPTRDLLELKEEETGGSSIQNTQPRSSSVKDSCLQGDKCKSLNVVSHGSGLSQLTKLVGHNKTITGIALLSDLGKLYTVSKDKCIRVWDCQTGQCDGAECLNGEVGCIITKGPWLFAGLSNNVKLWNLQHKVDFSLNASGGPVHCLEFDNNILFAGMEDGNILVWRGNPVTSDFELAATLKGHTGPVGSLIIGSGHGKLYSGSVDCSIKVWDQNLHCIQTLYGHTREVVSLLCWDKYLLSASLDKSLKVWGTTENGTMERVHEHKEDHGFLSMGGIMDHPEGQHILLCSLEDKSVRLYDFPTFVGRGRVSSKEQTLLVKAGIYGLFFIGDAAGEVSVWRLTESLLPR